MSHSISPLAILYRLFVVLLFVTLSACTDNDQIAALPPPSNITVDSVGYYCGMNLDEHIGPKGQIQLRDSDKTIWFSTIREVFAYTILPEEPKAIVAIYVQDMGQADELGNPPLDSWIDAKKAFYVINSNAIGGMGAPDALPFAKKSDAEKFIENNGGTLVEFNNMPEDYILRSPNSDSLDLTAGI